MSNLKTILFWTLITFAVNRISAQQQDAVFTPGIQIEKKISKQFSFSIYTQLALNENWTEAGYYFIDPGMNYRINRNFTIGLNYRFMQFRNLDNFYQDRQQVYGDLTWTKGRGPFSFSLRSRYVVKYYGMSFQSDENFRDNRHFLRNRLLTRYHFDNFNSIYVSLEQIYRFDTKNMNDAWKGGGGLTHNFDLHHRIDLGYSVYHRVNTKTPDTDFITSVTYYYKF